MGERETKEERSLLILKELAEAVIPTLEWLRKAPGEHSKQSYWNSVFRMQSRCVYFLKSQAIPVVNHSDSSGQP